ncbi:hypothetical protein [Rhizobium leguminosarum]|uniref:hypothetical protein n=1 Tax=Rhizobium leguminosarum TaxID=384 RepID=UPI001031F3F2|nr:hypothetical protein [Rhizobium leguminosarum]TAV48507.1 hypothetical protein ELI32_09895 [Rhizobium leguminosarum]TAV58007.1 hypothetical protein ELI31_09425 [Rhizobium leguminosarum]TAV68948.1 hypothetical protein ELI30_09440 [Rhizobium leguminosarum]TBZ13965.1 hypothetical protein E0H33_17785 [Rhizobium leguminosarum bv. viciae]
MDATDIVAEIEDVIRTAPDIYYAWGAPEHFDWLGRARAVLSLQEVGLSMETRLIIPQTLDSQFADTARSQLMVLLQSAKHALRMRAVGPMSLAVNKGMVFDYFDRLREIIEMARADLFFIDPYLDADFVSSYFPFVKPGVTVRLLGRERIKTLAPAVKAFCAQNGVYCEIKSGSGFHDRFVFVDSQRGVQSGASFKDGGLKTPTVLLELSDARPQILATYEKLWTDSALIEF